MNNSENKIAMSRVIIAIVVVLVIIFGVGIGTRYALTGKLPFSSNNTEKNSVIVDGKNTHYTDGEGYIKKTDIRGKDDAIQAHIEYYPKTKYNKKMSEHQKYVFTVDPYDNIIRATETTDGSQLVVKVFEYYPETKYGEHSKSLHHLFELSPDGQMFIRYMNEYNEETTFVNRYEYAPGTKYEEDGSHEASVEKVIPKE